MRIDLHAHSTESDGTDAPARVAELASAAGLDVVALTDHDTMAGVAEARDAAPDGLRVLAGVEVSTKLLGRSVHLLGYGCRDDHPELAAAFGRLQSARTDRIALQVARLAELGLPVTADEIFACAGNAPSVGRPHVADALVARGYVADRAEAFALWLDRDKPGYVPKYAIELEDAIGLVQAAGGVAVIAHARAKTGRDVLTATELCRLAFEHAVDGFEVTHPDHDQAVRHELAALAMECGVLATGGSDSHGAGKRAGYELGTCVTDPSVFERIEALVESRGGAL